MGLEEFPTFKKIYINTIKLFKDIINNPKAILNYCFRVAIFLVLMRIHIYAIFYTTVAPLLNPLVEDMEPFVDIGIIFFLTFPIYCYFCAKICGLFKKLDNLNFLTALLVIVFVDIMQNYSWNFAIELFPFKLEYRNFNGYIIILSFLFFVYKFFNYLSKKYIFFQKIGYYFSAEFYKDLYLRLKR